MKSVLSGIDRIDLMDKALSGKRLAVVTGGAAVDRNLRHVADVLCERYDVRRLFNTIYGIRGEFMYGERVRVSSVEDPEKSFVMNSLDIVVVPASLGRYTIENLGIGSVTVHKTQLKR